MSLDGSYFHCKECFDINELQKCDSDNVGLNRSEKTSKGFNRNNNRNDVLLGQNGNAANKNLVDSGGRGSQSFGAAAQYAHNAG